MRPMSAFLSTGHCRLISPPYERGVYIFDGNDEQALADARLRWKESKAAGHTVTYWQENDRGGFSKKA